MNVRCCKWYGITCSSYETEVTKLNLPKNYLQGSIPISIAYLSELQDLRLYGNNLNFSIPFQIGNLTKLTYLFLHSNKLTSSIPISIQYLSELQDLRLYGNNLNFSIPFQIGNLTKLTCLSLGSNKLTSSIPISIQYLSELQDLRFYENNLNSSIPFQIGNLTKLTVLDLNLNELTSPIPISIQYLSELQYLYLYGNNLNSSIPFQIGNLTKLTYLFLHSNKLTSSIPISIQYLSELQDLRLYGNNLNFSIPFQIGNLTKLTCLSLGSNKLTSSIPISIQYLSELQDLRLYENNLNSSIPFQIGNLTKLTYLQLGSNKLTSSLPISIGYLSKLQDLYFYGNSLNSSIPFQIGNLTKLTYLQLGSNELTSSIPISIGYLSELQYLYLYGNNLNFSIPFPIGNLTKLTHLFLNSNKLTSSIPISIGYLSELQYLYFYGNNLNSSIPFQIGNLKKLTVLDLNSNKLTSPIPISIGYLSKLQVLRLYENNLNSSIPSQIGNLRKLTYLSLNSNKLTSSIPISIEYLSNLESLVLYKNRLNGTIPFSFKLLNNVYNIFLQDNLFSGTISDIFYNVTKLKRFYISKNKFSGILPLSLLNHRSIKELYAHKNLFEGSIPDFSKMTLLKELSISENLFYGNIENKINNKYLKYFFCHNNQLSGSIPKFSQNNISQISLMNNKLKGNLNIVSKPYELYMVYNNLLSGKIHELNKTILSETYYPQNRIMYPVIQIHVQKYNTIYSTNGIYYLETRLQTHFDEIVYIHENRLYFLFWSRLTNNKWTISQSYDDLTPGVHNFDVKDENDRTSVIQSDTELLIEKFFIFGSILFDKYMLLKDFKNITRGSVLKLRETKNFDENIKVWMYVFEIERTNDTIEISSTLQNDYFVPKKLKWEPKISQNIAILGNNFDYKLNYDLIASDELSETLMTPEWNIWSFDIISSIVCFIILLYSTKFISKKTFNDKECFYHHIILNYSYKKSGKFLKHLYDFFMITLLFITYHYSSNYYEDGYWLDNLSITNMINSKKFEYLILFLFMIYSSSMYFLITLMDSKNCPIEVHKDAPNTVKISLKLWCDKYVVIYLITFVISIVLLFVYILFQFIPQDNVFSMNVPGTFGNHLNTIFPLIYSFLSEYVLPFILKRIKLNSKWESFITILATISFTFFLPLLFIFILSNNCCNLWVIFWKPCFQNLSRTGENQTFNIIQSKFPYESVLDHDSVCGVKYISQIYFDICTRNIFRLISDLSVKKLIYSGIVFPITTFSINLLKVKLSDYYSISLLKHKDEDHRFFNSLFNYITYLILFGFGCPLIIVVIYISIFFNLILLIFSKRYLNIQFMTSDYSISKMLFYLVLFVNHLLSLIFWISNKFVLPEIMISFLFLFWCIISVRNISFLHCQKVLTMKSVEIEMMENNEYTLLGSE